MTDKQSGIEALGYADDHRGEDSGNLRFVLDKDFTSEIIDSIIALHLSTSRWMLRRSDQIEFVDTTTTRKTTRIDIELPRGLTQTRWGESSVSLVPLGIFRRDIPLRGLQVKDETGRELSTLTKAENQKLMMGILHRLAGQQKGEKRLEIPAHLEIICKATRRNTPLYRDGQNAMADRWYEELVTLLRENTSPDDVALRTIIVDLWMGYLNIVVLPGSEAGRRTVTVVHEERLASAKEFRERDWLPFRSRAFWSKGRKNPFGGYSAGLELGSEEYSRVISAGDSGQGRPGPPGRLRRAWQWISTPSWMHVIWGQWSRGDVASPHVEIYVPGELEIVQALMAYPGGDPPDGERNDENQSLRFPSHKTWRVTTTSDNGPRGHLMPSAKTDWWLSTNWSVNEDEKQGKIECSDQSLVWSATEENTGTRDCGTPILGTCPEETSRGKIALGSLLLGANSGSMLTGAFALNIASILFLFAALGAVIFGDKTWVGEATGDLVTVLVFVPTIAAAVAAQPTAHPLSGSLVRPLRVMISIAGGLPVLAALVLLMQGDISETGKKASIILIGLGIAIVVFLAVCCVVQWRTRRKVPGHPVFPVSWEGAALVAGPQPNDKALEEMGSPKPVGQGQAGDKDARAESNSRRMRDFVDLRESLPVEAHIVISSEGLRFPVAKILQVCREEECEEVTDSLLVMAARRYAETAGWSLE